MMVSLEDSREMLAFVQRHGKEIEPVLLLLAEKAQRQIEWYYLDGQPNWHYDAPFYKEVLSKIAWGLMYEGPLQCDGYTYPDDAPRCMTSQLM